MQQVASPHGSVTVIAHLLRNLLQIGAANKSDVYHCLQPLKERLHPGSGFLRTDATNVDVSVSTFDWLKGQTSPV